MQRQDPQAKASAAASPRKAESGLSVDAMAFLIRALKKHWHCYRRELCRCQRKVSPRAVHDLRVEARRLISLLQLLSPLASADLMKKAEVCLKKHLDVFDDLRDTQVELSAIGHWGKMAGAAGEFQRALQKREARLEHRTLKQAKALHCKKLAKLVKMCRREAKDWLRQAGPHRANRVLLFTLEQAFETAAEQKAAINGKDPRSIHCTRIAFKKFRYMVEALAECWSWANKPLLAGLRRYQRLMGDIQDAEVFRQAFAEFDKKKSPEGGSARKFARQVLRRRDQLIAKYLESAERLSGFRPPAGDDSLRHPATRAAKPSNHT